MTKRTGIVVACLCVAAIVGCVSIEDTRAQLKSNDPAQVKLAEENILKVVSYQAFTSDRPEKYVELAEGNELLGKIIGCSQDPKAVAAALNKLDPTKPGTPNDLLLRMMEQSRDDRTCEVIAGKLDFRQAGFARELLDKHMPLCKKVFYIQYSSGSSFKKEQENAKDAKNFAEKILCGLGEQELAQVVKSGRLDAEWSSMAKGQLLEIAQDPAILQSMVDGELRSRVGDGVAAEAAKKLGANADKISDKATLIKLLESGTVKEEGQRRKLISRLPAEDAEVYTLRECKDDKMFYETFKKSKEQVKAKVVERALKMKDEALLADFIRNNPNYADRIKSGSVKTPELAMVLLDNMKEALLDVSADFYSSGSLDSRIDHFVFNLVSKLDAQARAKYLKVAKENLEAAKKDNLILGDKFYVNMPAIDYAVISFEENLQWLKDPWDNALDAEDYFRRRADMKTDIHGKDWRKEWKIESLFFYPKERQKYLNVKGTLDGLVDFVRKYIDKSATTSDITFHDGRWQFNDDNHGLSIFLSDKSGTLEVVRR